MVDPRFDFSRVAYLGGLIVTTHGRFGGNIKFMGLPGYLYSKQDHCGWFNQWVITLPFVVALRRVNDKGGKLHTLWNKPAGWTISFCKLRISVKVTGPELYQ